MKIGKLAYDLNLDEHKVEKLCETLDGVGFTEDQMVAILQAIKVWFE